MMPTLRVLTGFIVRPPLCFGNVAGEREVNLAGTVGDEDRGNAHGTGDRDRETRGNPAEFLPGALEDPLAGGVSIGDEFDIQGRGGIEPEVGDGEELGGPESDRGGRAGGIEENGFAGGGRVCLTDFAFDGAT